MVGHYLLLLLGDPLSPFLFILCGHEVLSGGNLHGIKVARNAPSITHLMFADDHTILFCPAKDAEAISGCQMEWMMSVLSAYKKLRTHYTSSRNLSSLTSMQWFGVPYGLFERTEEVQAESFKDSLLGKCGKYDEMSSFVKQLA